MAAQKLADAIAKTRQHLINIQNQEAGWFPYKKDGDPSMEASAWSLLAIDQVSAIQKGYSFISQAQNADGGWSTKPEAGRSDWTSALALLSVRLLKPTLQAIPDQNLTKQKRLVKAGVEYLLDARYTYKPATRLVMLVSKGGKALDKDRGWPWDPDCFHWIEPTAYSLMSLKLPNLPELYGQPEIKKVIQKGNKFILDHACRGGGWNHGNDITLGAFLPPYRLTTAEALLALQDLPDEDKVKAGLAYLKTWSDKNTSAMSIAMSALALMAFDQDATQEIDMLLARQSPEGTFASTTVAAVNTVTTAVCCMALIAFAEKKSLLFIGRQ